MQSSLLLIGEGGCYLILVLARLVFLHSTAGAEKEKVRLYEFSTSNRSFAVSGGRVKFLRRSLNPV